MANMTSTLQMQYREGTAFSNSEFCSWYSRFILPSGKAADPNTTDSLRELCEGEIGAVHTPFESIQAMDMGWVFVGIDIADGRLKSYAAVRLEMQMSTVVIDLLCVHPEWRHKGMGAQFYEQVMRVLGILVADYLAPETELTVSVQATFDYLSYLTALVNTAAVEKRVGTVTTFSVDEHQLAEMVTGSCVFWRRMGFEHTKMVTSAGEPPLARPVLLMWKKWQLLQAN
jgi:GNAT superfamily N-acetyltransferase